MVPDNNSVYKEVFMVLAYFDEEMLKKIPDTLLEKIKEYAAESKEEVYVDFNKELKNQDISEDAKDFISIIYYNYIADENEKIEIKKAWNNNEKEFQESFDSSKLFENRSLKNNNKDYKENSDKSLVDSSKNNVIKNIWLKIKSIIKGNNKRN